MVQSAENKLRTDAIAGGTQMPMAAGRNVRFDGLRYSRT